MKNYFKLLINKMLGSYNYYQQEEFIKISNNKNNQNLKLQTKSNKTSQLLTRQSSIKQYIEETKTFKNKQSKYIISYRVIIQMEQILLAQLLGRGNNINSIGSGNVSLNSNEIDQDNDTQERQFIKKREIFRCQIRLLFTSQREYNSFQSYLKSSQLQSYLKFSLSQCQQFYLQKVGSENASFNKFYSQVELITVKSQLSNQGRQNNLVDNWANLNNKSQLQSNRVVISTQLLLVEVGQLLFQHQQDSQQPINILGKKISKEVIYDGPYNKSIIHFAINKQRNKLITLNNLNINNQSYSNQFQQQPSSSYNYSTIFNTIKLKPHILSANQQTPTISPNKINLFTQLKAFKQTQLKQEKHKLQQQLRQKQQQQNYKRKLQYQQQLLNKKKHQQQIKMFKLLQKQQKKKQLLSNNNYLSFNKFYRNCACCHHHHHHQQQLDKQKDKSNQHRENSNSLSKRGHQCSQRLFDLSIRYKNSRIKQSSNKQLLSFQNNNNNKSKEKNQNKFNSRINQIHQKQQDVKTVLKPKRNKHSLLQKLLDHRMSKQSQRLIYSRHNKNKYELLLRNLQNNNYKQNQINQHCQIHQNKDHGGKIHSKRCYCCSKMRQGPHEVFKYLRAKKYPKIDMNHSKSVYFSRGVSSVYFSRGVSRVTNKNNKHNYRQLDHQQQQMKQNQNYQISQRQTLSEYDKQEFQNQFEHFAQQLKEQQSNYEMSQQSQNLSLINKQRFNILNNNEQLINYGDKQQQNIRGKQQKENLVQKEQQIDIKNVDINIKNVENENNIDLNQQINNVKQVQSIKQVQSNKQGQSQQKQGVNLQQNPINSKDSINKTNQSIGPLNQQQNQQMNQLNQTNNDKNQQNPHKPIISKQKIQQIRSNNHLLHNNHHLQKHQIHKDHQITTQNKPQQSISISKHQHQHQHQRPSKHLKSKHQILKHTKPQTINKIINSKPQTNNNKIISKPQSNNKSISKQQFNNKIISKPQSINKLISKTQSINKFNSKRSHPKIITLKKLTENKQKLNQNKNKYNQSSPKIQSKQQNQQKQKDKNKQEQEYERKYEVKQDQKQTQKVNIDPQIKQQKTQNLQNKQHQQQHNVIDDDKIMNQLNNQENLLKNSKKQQTKQTQSKAETNKINKSTTNINKLNNNQNINKLNSQNINKHNNNQSISKNNNQKSSTQLNKSKPKLIQKNNNHTNTKLINNKNDNDYDDEKNQTKIIEQKPSKVQQNKVQDKQIQNSLNQNQKHLSVKQFKAQSIKMIKQTQNNEKTQRNQLQINKQNLYYDHSIQNNKNQSHKHIVYLNQNNQLEDIKEKEQNKIEIQFIDNNSNKLVQITQQQPIQNSQQKLQRINIQKQNLKDLNKQKQQQPKSDTRSNNRQKNQEQKINQNQQNNNKYSVQNQQNKNKQQIQIKLELINQAQNINDNQLINQNLLNIQTNKYFNTIKQIDTIQQNIQYYPINQLDKDGNLNSQSKSQIQSQYQVNKNLYIDVKRRDEQISKQEVVTSFISRNKIQQNKNLLNSQNQQLKPQQKQLINRSFQCDSKKDKQRETLTQKNIQQNRQINTKYQTLWSQLQQNNTNNQNIDQQQNIKQYQQDQSILQVKQLKQLYTQIHHQNQQINSEKCYKQMQNQNKQIQPEQNQIKQNNLLQQKQFIQNEINDQKVQNPFNESSSKFISKSYKQITQLQSNQKDQQHLNVNNESTNYNKHERQTNEDQTQLKTQHNNQLIKQNNNFNNDNYEKQDKDQISQKNQTVHNVSQQQKRQQMIEQKSINKRIKQENNVKVLDINQVTSSQQNQTDLNKQNTAQYSKQQKHQKVCQKQNTSENNIKSQIINQNNIKSQINHVNKQQSNNVITNNNEQGQMSLIVDQNKIEKYQNDSKKDQILINQKQNIGQIDKGNKQVNKQKGNQVACQNKNNNLSRQLMQSNNEIKNNKTKSMQIAQNNIDNSISNHTEIIDEKLQSNKKQSNQSIVLNLNQQQMRNTNQQLTQTNQVNYNLKGENSLNREYKDKNDVITKETGNNSQIIKQIDSQKQQQLKKIEQISTQKQIYQINQSKQELQKLNQSKQQLSKVDQSKQQVQKIIQSNKQVTNSQSIQQLVQKNQFEFQKLVTNQKQMKIQINNNIKEDKDDKNDNGEQDDKNDKDDKLQNQPHCQDNQQQLNQSITLLKQSKNQFPIKNEYNKQILTNNQDNKFLVEDNENSKFQINKQVNRSKIQMREIDKQNNQNIKTFSEDIQQQDMVDKMANSCKDNLIQEDNIVNITDQIRQNLINDKTNVDRDIQDNLNKQNNDNILKQNYTQKQMIDKLESHQQIGKQPINVNNSKQLCEIYQKELVVDRDQNIEDNTNNKEYIVDNSHKQIKSSISNNNDYNNNGQHSLINVSNKHHNQQKSLINIDNQSQKPNNKLQAHLLKQPTFNNKLSLSTSNIKTVQQKQNKYQYSQNEIKQSSKQLQKQSFKQLQLKQIQKQCQEQLSKYISKQLQIQHNQFNQTVLKGKNRDRETYQQDKNPIQIIKIHQTNCQQVQIIKKDQSCDKQQINILTQNGPNKQCLIHTQHNQQAKLINQPINSNSNQQKQTKQQHFRQTKQQHFRQTKQQNYSQVQQLKNKIFQNQTIINKPEQSKRSNQQHNKERQSLTDKNNKQKVKQDNKQYSQYQQNKQQQQGKQQQYTNQVNRQNIIMLPIDQQSNQKHKSIITQKDYKKQTNNKSVNQLSIKVNKQQQQQQQQLNPLYAQKHLDKCSSFQQQQIVNRNNNTVVNNVGVDIHVQTEQILLQSMNSISSHKTIHYHHHHQPLSTYQQTQQQQQQQQQQQKHYNSVNRRLIHNTLSTSTKSDNNCNQIQLSQYHTIESRIKKLVFKQPIQVAIKTIDQQSSSQQTNRSLQNKQLSQQISYNHIDHQKFNLINNQPKYYQTLKQSNSQSFSTTPNQLNNLITKKNSSLTDIQKQNQTKPLYTISSGNEHIKNLNQPSSQTQNNQLQQHPQIIKQSQQKNIYNLQKLSNFSQSNISNNKNYKEENNQQLQTTNPIQQTQKLPQSYAQPSQTQQNPLIKLQNLFLKNNPTSAKQQIIPQSIPDSIMQKLAPVFSTNADNSQNQINNTSQKINLQSLFANLNNMGKITNHPVILNQVIKSSQTQFQQNIIYLNDNSKINQSKIDITALKYAIRFVNKHFGQNFITKKLFSFQSKQLCLFVDNQWKIFSYKNLTQFDKINSLQYQTYQLSNPKLLKQIQNLIFYIIQNKINLKKLDIVKGIQLLTGLNFKKVRSKQHELSLQDETKLAKKLRSFFSPKIKESEIQNYAQDKLVLKLDDNHLGLISGLQIYKSASKSLYNQSQRQKQLSVKSQSEKKQYILSYTLTSNDTIHHTQLSSSSIFLTYLNPNIKYQTLTASINNINTFQLYLGNCMLVASDNDFRFILYKQTAKDKYEIVKDGKGFLKYSAPQQKNVYLLIAQPLSKNRKTLSNINQIQINKQTSNNNNKNICIRYYFKKLTQEGFIDRLIQCLYSGKGRNHNGGYQNDKNLYLPVERIQSKKQKIINQAEKNESII